MMYLTRSCLAFGLLASALAACAAPPTNDDAESAAAATASGAESATLEVEETRIALERCNVLSLRPVVDAGDRAVNARIAAEIEAALPKVSASEVCADRPPATSKVIDQRFFDAANERGILSLSLSETVSLVPFPQPPGHLAHPETRAVGRTFELRSGRRLSLREVFTAQGLERIRAACLEANPTAGLGPEAAASLVEGCSEAVTTNRAGFTIDQEDVNVLSANPAIRDRFLSWESFRPGDLAASPVSAWLAGLPRE